MGHPGEGRTWAQGFSQVKALGCTHAELQPNRLFVTVGGRTNLSQVATIAEACQASGLRFTVHAPIAVNLMEPHHRDLHEAVLGSTLTFAQAIQASVVVVHPGRVHPQADLHERNRLLAQERDSVLRLADQAALGGVRIGIENLNPDTEMMAGGSTSYALDPRCLAEQVAAIAHPAVVATLDLGHAWLAAHRLGFDFFEAIRTLAPFVGHLHITDNCGRPLTYPGLNDEERIAYGMGDLHLPIGWGTVPYEDLIPQLVVLPGTVMIIEQKPRFANELGASVGTTLGFRTRLNASVPSTVTR